MSIASLKPHDRALFAVSSRLLICLVNESLTRALYIPIYGFEATAIAVVLRGNVANIRGRSYSTSDILAIVPLHQVPVFKQDSDEMRGKEIGLLDTLDMLPMIYEVRSDSERDSNDEHAELSDAVQALLSGPGWNLGKTVYLIPALDPIKIWENFGISIGMEGPLRKEIGQELENSAKWQEYSYEHPPRGPTFDSPSIEWEQSIVEGHPSYPMHMARRTFPPIKDISPGEYDFYHARIRLVAVPRENLKITYEFEKYATPIYEGAAKNANRRLEIPEGFVVVPVHGLQIPNIEEKFPEVKVYPPEFSVASLGQQSIRSVILPGVFQEHSLKLPIGVKLTSAMRTISPPSAYLGPRFSAQVVPKLTMDHNLLLVAKELASVVHAHPDGEVAKHCAAIIRESHENTSEERGERHIVCTALVESGHAGVDGNVPAVIRAFNLDTEEKRIAWLDRFIRLFFDAFLPSVIHNGVAFEAHPQNTIARFSLETRELVGFVIRDFGGLRVHLPTLLASTGQVLDVIPGHSIIAETLDDVYNRLYHAAIYNHLGRLIRVLGLHYNGEGWALVREHLRAAIPQGHRLAEVWLSPDAKAVAGKCIMTMRISGMYRFHLNGLYSNLIHYRGVEVDENEALVAPEV